MSGTVIVRDAKREDMPAVMDMIVELAAFEGYPNRSKLTAEILERDGFDVSPKRFVCMVAECTKTNKLVGYIFGNFAYSSWSGNAMYVEDFYVKSNLRGEKIGHRLWKGFCQMARDNECSRIDWHCLVDNEIAMNFYKSHGGYDLCAEENRTCLRAKKDAILNVANSED